MSCAAVPAHASRPARPARPAQAAQAARSAASSLLALLVLVALGVTGCGGNGGSAPSDGPTLSARQAAGGVQVFAVSGLPAMKFSASELVARPGTIRVDFSVPEGSAPHNFVIPSIPTAHTPIVSAGSSQSVTFTVTRPGDYQIVCTIHANMTATLKIT
ncbi:hypothetical protein [Frankia sp. AiPa1]|uniref:hypothetical protein n=1 Tax=Frankia sp. AiPa1 TaxID=573492 RepID=UPI00202B15B1|nr:hypothetical protein [Frankia sp. AiPa1]MCL9761864.1 hypothetical protein [Frankia sp. AiPa1]